MNIGRQRLGKGGTTSALRARPLQSSTNTIYSKQLKAPTQQQLVLKSGTNSFNDNDLKKTKKKTIETSQKQQENPQKVDENEVDPFVKHPYDPLLDTCALDEELYMKVKMLELADDGLPQVDSSEPFDF